MTKNRESIALLIAFVVGSLLLGFVTGIGFVATSTYLIPAIFLLYLGKYFWNDSDIFKKPVLGFTASELGYVFFGSIVLKTLISYVLSDFLQNVLSIGIVEWIVVALELLSVGALIILLSRLILKLIPR
jgi:hypothetical protein